MKLARFKASVPILLPMLFINMVKIILKVNSILIYDLGYLSFIIALKVILILVLSIY